ncbi:MAG: DUF3160 domain-containing protein [Myxococcales bacterium]|nr:DUF3160 domain-containing protein [Myxococcales bacterium]
MRRSLLGLLLVAACSTEPASPPAATDPGKPIAWNASALPTDSTEALAKIDAERKASAGLTKDTLLAKYPVPYATTLPYDPKTAVGVDALQKSSLALSSESLEALGKNGFVVTDARRFPSFVYGYASLYAQDLPLYVSADSVLYAVHQSYDKILQTLEDRSLAPSLTSLLGRMRAALPGAAMDAETKADADLFLTVAVRLLTKKPAAPVAGADGARVDALVAAAEAAKGMQTVTLFGIPREVDFSMFQVRGHYVADPNAGLDLEGYFRAMMWLGRTDFRFLETQPDGSQVLRRRQIEAALALRDLMGKEGRAEWGAIDATIKAFVGEMDDMSLTQLDGFATDLGVVTPGDLGKVADATLQKALLSGKYGVPKILSQVVRNGLTSGTLPMSSTFLFLGQRYVFDSHVFSNVVWDRTKAKRMMPNPLDVAFAALGNDSAAPLLSADLARYGYAPDLHMMRFLGDLHGAEFWQGSLYNLWMSSLRALSPSAEFKAPAAAGLPAVAATEPWGRRILSTQLASWAELRHDTVLYAKQSFTSGAACVFPDAYVDPYPAFYARIHDLAVKGKALVGTLPFTSAYEGSKIAAYFDRLATVSTKLREMAELQRKGLPITAEHLSFINEAVKVDRICDSSVANGWYAKLFFDPSKGVELDPVIADVHTQPTDEGGNTVGKVLHVATGMPRMMVVTVGGLDGCTTPRAYVGLASSYFEETTGDFKRYTDQEWSAKIKSATPPDVPWMTGVVTTK